MKSISETVPGKILWETVQGKKTTCCYKKFHWPDETTIAHPQEWKLWCFFFYIQQQIRVIILLLALLWSPDKSVGIQRSTHTAAPGNVKHLTAILSKQTFKFKSFCDNSGQSC